MIAWGPMPAASGEGPRAAPRSLAVAVLSLLAVACVYATTLDGTFVWDDRELILRSPSVRHLGTIGDYFGRPFWQESTVTHQPAVYYRPLVTLSYTVDYLLHGENPAGFHLTNVVWHLVVCALVFAGARARASTAVAAVVTVVFGLLPRLAECVAWIAGRTDPMAAAFTLGGVLVWTSRLRARRALGLALLAVALLCKEVALAGVVAVVVFEVREAWFAPRRARRLAAALAPLGLLTLGYLVLLRHVLGQAPRFQEASLDIAARVRTALGAMGTYAWLVVDPFQPRTRIGLAASPPAWSVAAGVLVAAAAVAGGVALTRRAPPRTLALSCLAAAAIAPVLHIVPFPYSILASDRFLYLPLAAAALAAAPSVQRGLERAPVSGGVVAAALVLALGARTYLRCLDWNDEVRFWADAVRTAPPGDTLPLSELGNVYYRAKLYEDAARAYEKSLQPVAPDADPLDVANVLSNVANAWAAAGDYRSAAAQWERVFALEPLVARNWYDRALLDLHVLDFEAARRDASRAIELAGDYPDARDLLGRLAELQREAARELTPAALAGTSPAAIASRARLFERLGRLEDAAAAWAELAASPAATSSDLETAAMHLVANGPIELAGPALERWRGRTAASPSLDEAVRALEARRAETERLEAVRDLTL
jgi:protein O-mannosyl-transferase